MIFKKKLFSYRNLDSLTLLFYFKKISEKTISVTIYFFDKKRIYSISLTILCLIQVGISTNTWKLAKGVATLPKLWAYIICLLPNKLNTQVNVKIREDGLIISNDKTNFANIRIRGWETINYDFWVQIKINLTWIKFMKSIKSRPKLSSWNQLRAERRLRTSPTWTARFGINHTFWHKPQCLVKNKVLGHEGSSGDRLHPGRATIQVRETPYFYPKP